VAKHTPGPWTAKLTGTGKSYCIRAGERYVGWTDDMLNGHTPRIEADARLMAAAPDLLAALEKVNYELAALVADPANPDWMPALGNSNPADAKCLQSAFEAARAAMALAEEQP
jgi:hypothetical protein